MRVTMFDRWLLLLSLVCMLMACAVEKASAACDDKCREVMWLRQENLDKSVSCYDFKDATCQYCYIGGNCDSVNGPGKGVCTDMGKVECSMAEDCKIVCTLGTNGTGEAAPGVTKNKYFSVTRKLCGP